MRQAVAKWLVRWASGWINTTYYCWMLKDRGIVGGWLEDAMKVPTKRINKIALPLAKLIHKEAHVDQMIEEGWWG